MHLPWPSFRNQGTNRSVSTTWSEKHFWHPDDAILGTAPWVRKLGHNDKIRGWYINLRTNAFSIKFIVLKRIGADAKTAEAFGKNWNRWKCSKKRQDTIWRWTSELSTLKPTSEKHELNVYIWETNQRWIRIRVSPNNILFLSQLLFILYRAECFPKTSM